MKVLYCGKDTTPVAVFYWSFYTEWASHYLLLRSNVRWSLIETYRSFRS